MMYIILLGLLFIPKQVVILTAIDKWFSLSIVLNPILLMLIAGLIIAEQFIKFKNEKK